MQLAVLLPAHNEASGITDAVKSVLPQADRVIVVADNCTDDTAKLAQEAGADVFLTSGNTARKAGALNQALAALLPTWSGLVMIMDADSTVSDNFLATAKQRLEADPLLGAVGGVFYGKNPQSWIEQAQANEYARYSRKIAQHRGRVSVLTGTAAVFRPEALQQLLDARGFIYDPDAITEDNEMTLAMKTLGWKLVSPHQCTVETELMPTVRALRTQRLRWYRGALDNLLAYGWTPVTRRYWGQQFGLAAATLSMLAYLVATVWGVALGAVHFSAFWAVIGVGFLVERLITVWRVGPRGRTLAALMIPELFYDVVLQTCFVQAVWTVLRRKNIQWGHLPAREEV